MRRSLVLLVAVAISGSTLAHAEVRKRVAILDVVMEGISADVAAQLETSVEEELRRSGYQVVSHAATNEVIAKHDELYDGCAFGPCVEPIARALKVERLLDVRVSAEGQSYSFVVSMVEGTHGASLGQVVTSCGVCTVADALSKMTSAVRAMDGQVFQQPHPADATPIVVMASESQGASKGSHSKVVPVLLIVSGLLVGGGGAAVVAATDTHDPGWVAVGSGGTLLLSGIVMLATQD